jgi:hypothetical protein
MVFHDVSESFHSIRLLWSNLLESNKLQLPTPTWETRPIAVSFAVLFCIQAPQQTRMITLSSHSFIYSVNFCSTDWVRSALFTHDPLRQALIRNNPYRTERLENVMRHSLHYGMDFTTATARVRGVKYYTLLGLSCHFVGHVELHKSINEEQSRNDEHGERNRKVASATWQKLRSRCACLQNDKGCAHKW